MTGLKEMRTGLRAKYSKYSVSAVAKYMGVSNKTYRTWEAHPERLTLERAKKLAEYFDCTTDDLIFLDKDGN